MVRPTHQKNTGEGKSTKKRKNERSVSEPPPMRRRSQQQEFNFTKQCILCGEVCLEKDSRHPERWDKVCQCETNARPGQKAFKQQLLYISEGRGNEWARDVELRLAGVSDLPPLMDNTIYVAIMHTENLFSKQKTVHI